MTCQLEPCWFPTRTLEPRCAHGSDTRSQLPIDVTQTTFLSGPQPGLAGSAENYCYASNR